MKNPDKKIFKKWLKEDKQLRLFVKEIKRHFKNDGWPLNASLLKEELKKEMSFDLYLEFLRYLGFIIWFNTKTATVEITI